MRARAYLVQESNGIWYAKYLNDNRWTKQSLHVTKKSVARIKGEPSKVTTCATAHDCIKCYSPCTCLNLVAAGVAICTTR